MRKIVRLETETKSMQESLNQVCGSFVSNCTIATQVSVCYDNKSCSNIFFI